MPATIKPAALMPGGRIAVVATASPAEPDRVRKGVEELQRLGYRVAPSAGALTPEGYFAGSITGRRSELLAALDDPDCAAVIAARGGYGSTYLLDGLETSLPASPKILLGHSDLTCLQVYLWQKRGWVTFYGPMVAAGFDQGAEAAGGYDHNSFQSAVVQSERGWALDLGGEAIVSGDAEGVLLGGCLTLIRSTIGTPWELDTRGTILLLEDRALKPYQMDRALMHLKQAGKFAGVKGIILGEFPEWGTAGEQEGTPRAVAVRVLGALGIPVVWGAAVGHTPRPMLTLPLGIRCRLRATRSGLLEFLEVAVTSLKLRVVPRQKEGGQA